ncbi:hypothetical protein [Salinarimonas sp.]|uniref:hypothetical protein n=1 Tax=Salinarimonas sp. TaxID=2766526 RepID=UPI0032D94C83
MSQTTPAPEDPERLKARLEHEDRLLEMKLRVWERAVETQQHFNEMAVKSRQMGLTLVVAALGLAAFLFTRFEESLLSARLFGLSGAFHISGVIVLLSAFALFAVMRLDLGVYHKMLRGAVRFNERFEQEGHLRKLIGPEFGLTTGISHYSRYDDADYADGKLSGNKRRNAAKKLQRFYRYAIIFLTAVGVVLTVATWNADVARAPVGEASTEGDENVSPTSRPDP